MAQSRTADVKTRFTAIVTQFTNELSLSYPELEKPIASYLKHKNPFEGFAPLAAALKAPVATRDDNFFLKSGGKGIEILPGIFFSAKLWLDTSKETRVVFWDYLASLILLNNMFVATAGSNAGAAASGGGDGGATASVGEEMPDFEEMMKEMSEGFKSEEFRGIFENMKNMFKDLSGASVPSAGDEDEGAEKVPFEMPKIPEHLQNGLIAKIAAELAGEFKPEDLGIDTELMEKMNPMQIFEHLQHVYEHNPSLLTEAMKRVAGKIQGKFASGALNRDALMREAKELMTYFTDNPAFKDMMESFSGIFENPLVNPGGGKGSQSERLAAAKERLRKKAEAKKQQKKKN